MGEVGPGGASGDRRPFLSAPAPGIDEPRKGKARRGGGPCSRSGGGGWGYFLVTQYLVSPSTWATLNL
jgi:hypothetical protein